jgi:hypothetical protein
MPLQIRHQRSTVLCNALNKLLNMIFVAQNISTDNTGIVMNFRLIFNLYAGFGKNP